MPAARSRRHRLPRPAATTGRRRDPGRRRRPDPVRHQQRLARARRGRRAPGAMGFTAEARRRRHQRAERGPAAGGPIATRRSGSRRRHRCARRRNPQGRACGRSDSSSDEPGRRRSRTFAADRLGRPRRGGAGHPRRSTVGRRERRPHAAVRTRTAARQRGDGRRAARPPPTASRRSRASRSRRCCRDALARGDFQRPLVVGDRLDTDIAGANAAGLPSLLVLTGVSTAADMVLRRRRRAPELHRRGPALARTPDADALRVGPHPAWRVDVGPTAMSPCTRPAGTPGRSAVASSAPSRAPSGAPSVDGRARSPCIGGDDTARQALDALVAARPRRIG